MHRGVLFVSTGPSYETPAEINMISRLGGDAVSMSTVPEVLVARANNIKVAGISCITNLAAGLSAMPLSHDDVTDVAKMIKKKFENLLPEQKAILQEAGHKAGVFQRKLLIGLEKANNSELKKREVSKRILLHKELGNFIKIKPMIYKRLEPEIGRELIASFQMQVEKAEKIINTFRSQKKERNIQINPALKKPEANNEKEKQDAGAKQHDH